MQARRRKTPDGSSGREYPVDEKNAVCYTDGAKKDDDTACPGIADTPTRKRVPPIMFALNFYTDLYEEALRNGRKTVTIRLGDKTDKYQPGQLVWVTVGQRYGKRQKLFTAILDNVEVKLVADLSPRDITKENPEFRSREEVLQLLRRIYGPEVSMEDTVTVIHFSPVNEY